MHTIKYPKGLFVLIFTGFWERFSFYGTLTILLLYLTHVFSFQYPTAYAIWGAFIALGYITPAIGGWLADYILGFEQTLILGSVLIISGFLFLTFPSEFSLYLGLSLSLCGGGLFKGTISSLVGMLYLPGDIKRHDAYSKYFMGMSLGAILGPFVYGLVIVYWNWHAAFLMSALGNLLGLVIFIKSHRKFDYVSLPESPNTLETSLHTLFFIISLILIVSIIGILFAYPLLGNNLMAIASISTMVLGTVIMLKKSEDDTKKIIGLMLLNIILIFYYAAIFQINGSLIVGIEKEFHVQLFGWPIPATTFASLQAFFAILLTPILIQFWDQVKHYYFTPSIFLKITVGIIFAGLGFTIYSFVFSHPVNTLSFLIVASFILGISTAIIMPLHLIAVSHYAPIRVQGTLMGMSYLSDALGGFIGSNIIKLTIPFFSNTSLYTNMYLTVAVSMIALMIIWILIIPFMHYLLESTRNTA